MGQENLYPLPETWHWVALQDIATIGSHQIIPFDHPEQLFNYLALENVETGTGRIIDFSPTFGKDIKSNKFLFTREDVLFGKLRPYLRKVLTPDFDGISATDLLPLRPDCEQVNRYFLKWWLLSPTILDYVTAHQTGVKMPRLRSVDLGNLPVPLPPIYEQQRIVAILDSLFAQIRIARAAFERVSVLLKTLRQSVLAEAFRGELTEHDRDDEPAEVLLERIQSERRRRWEEGLLEKGKDPTKFVYPQPSAPDTSDLPKLPKGWVWTSFDELLIELKNGYFSRAPVANPPGIAILRISSVRPNSVNLDDRKYIPYGESILGYELQDQDLLFTRYNGTLELVGVCGMVRGLSEMLIYPDKLIRVRVVSDVFPEYLELFFASQLPRKIIEEKAKSSAGQTGISGKDIKGLPVLLPPLKEQLRLIKKIKQLFHSLGLVEEALSIASHRLNGLEQTILARAFRGEV